MKTSMLILLAASFLAVVALAQSVDLAWDASGGVAGYRLYYGTNSRAYSYQLNAGLVNTQRVVLPRNGRWFFAVKSYDTNKVESPFSNEVEWESLPPAPVLAGKDVVRICPVIERSTNLVNWTAAAGNPTFFPATNKAEFFRATRLTIEKVKRVE
ncbi:MAG: hypothetical protein ABSA45_12385 [Verrucomicrobiota bacterium]|jgi:hypothetical protein